MRQTIRLTENDLHQIVKESVKKILKESKEISIAPSMDEIEVNDNGISTDWNGGIFYEADMTQLFDTYSERALKSAFQQAIALSSKPWQIERLLNEYFKIYGKIQ